MNAKLIPLTDGITQVVPSSHHIFEKLMVDLDGENINYVTFRNSLFIDSGAHVDVKRILNRY